MNNQAKALLDKIKKKQAELIYLGDTFGLTSLQTLKCSVELDRLIVQYQKSSIKK